MLGVELPHFRQQLLLQGVGLVENGASDFQIFREIAQLGLDLKELKVFLPWLLFKVIGRWLHAWVILRRIFAPHSFVVPR